MNMPEGPVGQNKEGINEGEWLAKYASELWRDIRNITLENQSPIEDAFTMPESKGQKNDAIAYTLNISNVAGEKTPVQVEYERLLKEGTRDAEIVKDMREIAEYLERIKDSLVTVHA